MNENKKVLKRKERGVTLIALVITIIVLLILAGISIAMLTGENGILTQAQRAKEETEEIQANEGNILNDYEDYLSQVINGGFVESKGVNAPVLGENMELVSYDENTKTWVTDNSSSAYDYVAGEGTEDNNSSKWANAKVTIDGVDSYFVWIPRYAYKITYNNPEDITQGGTIDVKFLKGTSNIAADGTVCKYADDSTLNKEEDYIIHPAFTSNIDLGGWDSELLGIWIGKYEAARLDATSESDGESTKIKVQAGVKNFRNETIGNMYTYAREYSLSLNSHMLKNSEWGAVAYLTHSKYGRNGKEVTINNSSKCITGSAGNSINAEVDVGTTNDYTNSQGVRASSTGNIYGIYDLSGESNEYVAAYYTETTLDLIENGKQLKEELEKKFVTQYTEEIVKNNYKIGDASYETDRWNSDGNFFFGFTSTFPFIKRGGDYTSNSNAGIFCFNASEGISDSGKDSFRLCLII